MCDDLKKKNKNNEDLVKNHEELQEEIENVNIDNISDSKFKVLSKNLKNA